MDFMDLNPEFIQYGKLLLVGFFALLMILNRKISVWKIFLEQVKVFRNARTKKLSVLDIFSFILCPILLSAFIVYAYGFVVSAELAMMLATAFSLMFTLLFAFEAMLVSKKNSDVPTEKIVVRETFVTIMSTSILSLVASILSIVITIVTNTTALEIMSCCILVLGFAIIMQLLLIIKRTFIVYMNDTLK